MVIYSPLRIMSTFFFNLCAGQGRYVPFQRPYSSPATVRTGCNVTPETGANIIFIEKRRSFPATLRRRQAKVPDSCSHERKALWRPPDIERETRDAGGSPPTRSLSRTSNVFLTKMNACAGNALLKQPVRTVANLNRAGKMRINPNSHTRVLSFHTLKNPL